MPSLSNVIQFFDEFLSFLHHPQFALSNDNFYQQTKVIPNNLLCQQDILFCNTTDPTMLIVEHDIRFHEKLATQILNLP